MPRPSFDQTEGFALAILDTLASGKRPSPPPRDRSLEPSEELVRVGAERLSVHCHRLLLAGGAAERTVLRNGRRMSGRLWDAETTEGFRLRFTSASKDLWLGVTHAVLHGGAVDRLRATVEATDTGDWIFYAEAGRNLERLGAELEPTTLLSRRLRAGSPLAVLFTARPHTPHLGAVRNHLARLTSKRARRILECLDRPLVEAWTIAVVEALTLRDIERFTQRFTEIAAVLESHLLALDDAGRLDLARALLHFSVAFATELVEDPEELRSSLTDRLRPRSMRERTAALTALARVAAVGTELETHRGRLAAARYGDARWDEGQLFLRDFDDVAGPHLERIRHTERALRGTLT